MIALRDERITRPEAVTGELPEVLRLDIGGGAAPYAPDEYVVVDKYADAPIKADLTDLPLADGCVERIWASHVLEHVAMADVSRALAEWFRVLAPGGRAIVRVPNLDYVAKYWLTGPDRPWAEAMVFGHQANEGEFHKSGHTAGSIRADLEGAGFEVLRVEMRWTHNQETLQAVARKPKETP